MSEFEGFEKEVNYWCELFGLKDWRIEIKQQYLHESDEDTQSRTWLNWTQHTARIVWNENHRNDKLNACAVSNVPETALHEVLHIVLHKLISVAVERKSHASDEIDAEEHAVIRRLIHALTFKN